VIAVQQWFARQLAEARLRPPVSSSSQGTSQASELRVFGKVLLACTLCMTADASLLHGIVGKEQTLLRVGLAPDSLFGELGTKLKGTLCSHGFCHNSSAIMVWWQTNASLSLQHASEHQECCRTSMVNNDFC